MPVELWAFLYAGLAQALSPPGFSLPDWLAAPGREWPLFDAAVRLAAQKPSPHWRQAIEALTEVTAGSQERLRAEYQTLFVGTGSPPIWLYECHHIDGRIPGPSTFVVQSLYKKANLEFVGAELSDHAALELSFLAYLCEQEVQAKVGSYEWDTVRRLFIKKHAGRWLPDAARAMTRSKFPTWKAIGYLLIASVEQGTNRIVNQKPTNLLPEVSNREGCSLCGFCIQVCPTKALRIREDKHTTALWLLPPCCIQCSKCESVCETGGLTLTNWVADSPVLLQESQRGACSMCGSPTVSQAELEAIAARLGERPDWLFYCLECRSSLL